MAAQEELTGRRGGRSISFLLAQMAKRSKENPMSAPELEMLVRELKDREMIKELTHQYAHCVRQQDVEGVVNLFAEEGTVEVGATVIQGRAALRQFYADTLSKPGTLYDFLHNHVIRIQGERATGLCSVEVRGVQDGKNIIGAGHYDDEYVRVGGEWKFQRRKITLYYWVGRDEG